jgi:hypothetical protein
MMSKEDWIATLLRFNERLEALEAKLSIPPCLISGLRSQRDEAIFLAAEAHDGEIAAKKRLEAITIELKSLLHRLADGISNDITVPRLIEEIKKLISISEDVG